MLPLYMSCNPQLVSNSLLDNTTGPMWTGRSVYRDIQGVVYPCRLYLV